MNANVTEMISNRGWSCNCKS